MAPEEIQILSRLFVTSMVLGVDVQQLSSQNMHMLTLQKLCKQLSR